MQGGAPMEVLLRLVCLHVFGLDEREVLKRENFEGRSLDMVLTSSKTVKDRSLTSRNASELASFIAVVKQTTAIDATR
jgi:hypothetical protein